MKYINLLLIFILSLSISNAKKVYYLRQETNNEICVHLQNLDSNNIYAVMRGDAELVVYHSTDQGKSWDDIIRRDHMEHFPEDSVLNVDFCKITDTDHMYFSYFDYPIILYTEDGGASIKHKTVSELMHRQNYSFKMFDMYDNNTGFALGNGGDTLVVTRDGWKTYDIRTVPESYPTFRGDVIFIDSANIAFCVNIYHGPGFVRYNIDEDKFYDYSQMPVKEEGYGDKEFYDFCFVNDSLAYGCGMQEEDVLNDLNDVIWKTTDKGKTWNIIYCDSVITRCTKIAFANEYIGVVGGHTDEYMFTYDGGQTWIPFIVASGVYESYGYGIELAFAGSYWIVTSSVRGIFRYEDDNTGIASELYSNVNIKKIHTMTDFHIEIEDSKNRDFEILVVSMDGRKILDQKLSSAYSGTSDYIDLVSLPQGSYMYLVSSNNQLVATGKFVNVR